MDFTDIFSRTTRMVIMFVIVMLSLIYVAELEIKNTYTPALIITSGFMFLDTYYPRVHYE